MTPPSQSGSLRLASTPAATPKIDRRHTREDRRRGRRAPFVAAVRQRVGAEIHLALAQNLGETGMELRRIADGGGLLSLAPGRGPMTLAFELPDGGELVRVQGAVVFERACGRFQSVGVRFEAISREDRARIARFLDDRLR